MYNQSTHPAPLLATAYFPPVQWFTKLTGGRATIESHESFQKQTYRNRCLIDSPQGALALTVPVVHDDERLSIDQVRLSNHGNWRHVHWNAISSTYGRSPFFEYYEDDLRCFFTDDYERLFDLNEAIVRKLCELIDLDVVFSRTDSYCPTADNDWRSIISPKTDLTADPDFRPVPYYQLFAAQHGFLPNLSVLDLLCNMGPESLLVLQYPKSN